MDPRDALLTALKAAKIERQLAELLTVSLLAIPYLDEEGEPVDAAVDLNRKLGEAYVAAVTFREERVTRW